MKHVRKSPNSQTVTNEISPRSFVACVAIAHANTTLKLRVGCSEGVSRDVVIPYCACSNPP